MKEIKVLREVKLDREDFKFEFEEIKGFAEFVHEMNEKITKAVIQLVEENGISIEFAYTLVQRKLEEQINLGNWFEE